MDSKKIIMLLVVLGLLGGGAYFAMDMFSGNAPEQSKVKVIPNPDVPKPAPLTQIRQEKAKDAPPMTEREMQLVQEQQRMQQKYLATLTNLQQLTADLAIAEANKLIMKARKETIEAQVKIVSLLATPDSSRNYSDRLGSGSTPSKPAAGAAATSVSTSTGNATVISVTNIRGKWSAVLGLDGKLYSVSVGDTLPGDSSVVTSISKSGITVIKDNKEVKMSMNAVI